MSYNNFLSKFRINNVNVARDRRYESFRYNYSQTASYYTDREEVLEMEITRSGFEALVDLDADYTRMWQDKSDEQYLRKMHPALKDAYDKYRMLLELYK